jgi:CubicO group peptidase (beta-lactamase class C family)
MTVTPGQPGVYAAGSITKTFTAAGVMLLVHQGRLGLDDPLSRHFPELDPQRLTRDGRAVTLDDLLTHTSPQLARRGLGAVVPGRIAVHVHRYR